ncbi:hypothetical protein [Chryseosolibacter indicus]|uniref:DUF4397 domain-containing protein n=1 Tax=Chryseosolibacter indicus TaxID=2782351 RepID=A0ABS5VZD5_9BACT|nr:hypothetical protein [Chryseosolibacter indicus]MBT1706114.1 hypothetical protein [Chryseosolibacter indicus]
MKNYISSAVLACIVLAMVSCSEDKVVPQTEDAVISINSHQDSAVDYDYETLSNGTVRFSFENNTGHAITGELIRIGGTFENGIILTDFAVPADGTYSYVDDNVWPGKTYQYIFSYSTAGSSGYIWFTDEVIPVSDIPALGHFTIIAPSVDDVYDLVTDGYTVTLGGANIGVEANADKTRSVIFYLNGKKFKDNAAPFALFGDDNGDYHRGRLKNGTYTLMAIAYPKKNGKGVPGDTATVNFNVNNIYQDGQ